MASLIPYFTFVGESRDAIAFYKTVLGGDAEVQEADERVIQFDFKAGGIHFMGSDLGSDLTGRPSLVLNCDSEDQLKDLYAALFVGGHEVFAPTDSGWGAIVAHCIDQFGVTWMLNYDRPND